MALGAQRRDILILVLRNGLFYAVIGIVAGLVLALITGRLIQSRLYGVSADDPLIFVVVAVLLAATTLVACLIPARRATRVDPASALRNE